ncbi:MAG TPA: DUF3142 domain-containing protein [Tahibacter sp.]|uniref:DUF3142 domain-containing protein n=1 Tax=Tahibacter sp. TaxID=2056211 RepID=UPI002B71FE66|nr:DUF3142 domain-containing protein [Tahibacter sp.]HSX60526.1 DUF3142 domain-containing protein [Tahibacter sp.]
MTRRRRCTERLAAIALASIAVLLGACAERAAPALPHSVYVWQRVWDPALRDAVAESKTFATSLRVLALQFGTGGATSPDIDWDALRAAGLPVTLVVRIEGAAAIGPDRLGAFLTALRERGEHLRRNGFARFDLEIDHDCATAQLDAYAALLARIRADVGGIDTLTITALPAWRDAPALDAVLAQVDASVLQVHAVDDPAQGLFDGATAQRRVAVWARRSGAKPFLVALPAYGARLKLDAGGAVVAVESEQRLPARSAVTREVRVDPREIEAWLRELRAQRHPNLAGVAWFRLPRDGDERAWALRTLRAVVKGQPLQPALRVVTQTGDTGVIDVWLHSEGTLDAPRAALAVDGRCTAGDGANGYRLMRGTAWRLEPDRDEPLRAGSTRLVGWLRCDGPAGVRVAVD